MSAQFFETLMGKRFIEGTMSSIMRSLDRIADALEKMNEEKAHVPQWDGHGTILDEDVQPKQITADMIDRVILLHKDGCTVEDIAEDAGISPSRVETIIECYIR